jgi:hypothetical protein
VLHVDGRGNHVLSVAVTDSFVAYTLNGSIYYSADNGESWSSSFIAGGGRIVYHTSEEFLVSSPQGAKTFNASDGSIADFETAGMKGYDFSDVEMTEHEILVSSSNLFFTLSHDLFTINKASEALNGHHK